MGTLATHGLMAWSKPDPICNGEFEPGLKNFILHSFLPKQHSPSVQLHKLLMLILSIIDEPQGFKLYPSIKVYLSSLTLKDGLGH